VHVDEHPGLRRGARFARLRQPRRREVRPARRDQDERDDLQGRPGPDRPGGLVVQQDGGPSRHLGGREPPGERRGQQQHGPQLPFGRAGTGRPVGQLAQPVRRRGQPRRVLQRREPVTGFQPQGEVSVVAVERAGRAQRAGDGPHQLRHQRPARGGGERDPRDRGGPVADRGQQGRGLDQVPHRRPGIGLGGGQFHEQPGAAGAFRRHVEQRATQVPRGQVGGAPAPRFGGRGPQRLDLPGAAQRVHAQQLRCHVLRRKPLLGQQTGGRPVRGGGLRRRHGLLDDPHQRGFGDQPPVDRRREPGPRQHRTRRGARGVVQPAQPGDERGFGVPAEHDHRPGERLDLRVAPHQEPQPLTAGRGAEGPQPRAVAGLRRQPVGERAGQQRVQVLRPAAGELVTGRGELRLGAGVEPRGDQAPGAGERQRLGPHLVPRGRRDLLHERGARGQAVREDDAQQDPRPAQPGGQERQRAQGLFVRPAEVVDEHHDGPGAGQRGQEDVQPVQQEGRPGGVRGGFGQRAEHRAGDGGQRRFARGVEHRQHELADDAEREGLLGRGTARPQDPRAAAPGDPGQLPQQRGAARAGRATDHEQAAGPAFGRQDGVFEDGELCFAFQQHGSAPRRPRRPVVGEGGPALEPELAVHLGQPQFDRPQRDRQFAGDLPVRQAARGEPGDVSFGGRQRVRPMRREALPRGRPGHRIGRPSRRGHGPPQIGGGVFPQGFEGFPGTPPFGEGELFGEQGRGGITVPEPPQRQPGGRAPGREHGVDPAPRPQDATAFPRHGERGAGVVAGQGELRPRVQQEGLRDRVFTPARQGFPGEVPGVFEPPEPQVRADLDGKVGGNGGGVPAPHGQFPFGGGEIPESIIGPIAPQRDGGPLEKGLRGGGMGIPPPGGRGDGGEPFGGGVEGMAAEQGPAGGDPRNERSVFPHDESTFGEVENLTAVLAPGGEPEGLGPGFGGFEEAGPGRREGGEGRDRIDGGFFASDPPESGQGGVHCGRAMGRPG
jgi:hypothetical protein